MEEIRIRDVKKALRLCGWELVMVDGNRCFYRHPAVPEVLTILGSGNDLVSSELLSIVERQVGLCFCPVLA